MNKQRVLAIFIACASGPVWSAQQTIPLGHMLSRSEEAMEKPQIARDLDGLDPKEGGISKGLRGSFTIKHYISGPWTGGTAVIELASDLSYAEIRIFDKDSNLQRIYSIQPRAQNARINAAHINNPLQMVQENSSGNTRDEPAPVSVTRSPEREAAVQAQTVQAVHEHEAEVAQMRPGTVSSRAGDIREGSIEDEIAARERAESAPKKKVIRVRKKRPHKHSKNPLDTPLSGHREEDDYYYEEVVVTEKTSSPGAQARAAEQADQERQAQQPVQVAMATPQATSSVMPRAVPPPPPAPVARTTPIPQPVTTPIPAPKPVPPSSPASSAYDDSNLPDVGQAVRENDSEKPSGRTTTASDQWKPKVAQMPSTPEVRVEPGVVSPDKSGRGTASSASASDDMSEAQRAAAKLDSDAWSPKPSGPAPTDAELGITNASGGTSRRSGRGKSGGTGDSLVPMAEGVRNGQVGEEGENWAPNSKQAKLSKQDEQTLAMINTLKSPSNTAVVKVNRDVNNPEEGVKPFYSLEKYSGAQYGRHREFERRVMYKQNIKSSFKGYDFYIDEVDRKQEKHYLYYYKIDTKTKKAKLLATEKHERVTFLSNYDIGSEDKGKLDKE
jgi:hypothetical protein